MTCVIDEGDGPCLSIRDTPGSANLMTVTLDRHPELHSLGICACRDIRNSSDPSVHRRCGALDVAGRFRADPAVTTFVDALVLVADQLGVQRIIWNRRIWDCRRGWHFYTGPAGAHDDHTHVELTRNAARTLTMNGIVQAFGLPRHRRPVDVPKATDVVDALDVPGRARIKLQYQGGVEIEQVGPHPLPADHFRGSWFTLPASTRQGQVGRFLSIIHAPSSPDDPFAYEIVDTNGNAYTFDLAERQRAIARGSIKA